MVNNQLVRTYSPLAISLEFFRQILKYFNDIILQLKG